MTTKILVMGLPGSGKTYFADKLKKELESILGTELNEDSELFSIINEEEETLDRDKL